MNPIHRVVMNTGILYARMAITVVLSLYTTRVVLDALGVEDFGIFNLVGGVIAMLTFLNASMAAATQRFMSFAQGQRDKERQHQIFNVSMVLHAGIAVSVIGLLEIAGYILFDGVLKIAPERTQAAWLVYQFAVASTFITILGVPYDAVINARENMLLFAILGVIEATIKLTIALIILDATTDKLVLYGLLMAVTTVALLTMRVGYCHLKYGECKYSLRRYFNRSLFAEMTAFAGWSLLGSSTSMLANYGQVLVMNMFFGATVNAAQALAMQISGQLSVFGATMLRALNPLIVKSEGAGDRDRMLKASIAGSKISFFLLMLFFVPVIIEMPYLFKIWIIEIPQYTEIFCLLLLLRILLEQLFITLSISISAVGGIKSYQIATSFMSLAPLFVAYILFDRGFPPSALYYVFIIYSVCTIFVTVYFAKYLVKLDVVIYYRNVIVPCITTFVLVLATSSLPLLVLNSGLNRFLLILAISTLTFVFTVWLIGLNRAERKYVCQLKGILITKFLVIRGKYL